MSGDRSLSEMTVADVLQQWPETAEVFHHHNMACVGCAVAPFYTVTDVANVYGLSPARFVSELEEAIHKGRAESASD